MTGRMPSLHGVRMNGIPLSTDAVTFVDLLRDAGYRTALIGKSTCRTSPGSRPMARRSPKRAASTRGRCAGRGEPARFPRARLHAGSPVLPVRRPDAAFLRLRPCGPGHRARGRLRRRLCALAARAGARRGQAARRSEPASARLCLSAGGAHGAPEALYPTSYVAERAVSWLEAAGGEPFFLMVSFPDPHHPFNPPGRYWDAYRPEDMPVPAAFERNDWTPPPHVAALHRERDEGEAALHGMNSIGCTLREALEARALTCGMIEMIDDAIARVLAALERGGGAGQTVPAFTTTMATIWATTAPAQGRRALSRDHPRAAHLGRPGTGHLARARRTWRKPSTSPTVLERARVEPFHGMQGRSPARWPRSRRRLHPIRPPAAASRPRRAAAARGFGWWTGAGGSASSTGRTGRTLRSRSRPRRVPQPLGRSAGRSREGPADGTARRAETRRWTVRRADRAGVGGHRSPGRQAPR